jgi:hypothetical protein
MMRPGYSRQTKLVADDPIGLSSTQDIQHYMESSPVLAIEAFPNESDTDFRTW